MEHTTRTRAYGVGKLLPRVVDSENSSRTCMDYKNLLPKDDGEAGTLRGGSMLDVSMVCA